MEIIASNLSILFQNIQLAFLEAYSKETDPFLEKIATIVPSTTTEEIYPWVAELPQLREWVGERVANDIATYSYSLKNKDWELTAKLDRNLVQDDKAGMFTKVTVPMIAKAAKRKPGLLVRDILRTGQSLACYDGQNFFDASHPISKFPGSGVSGTQQNYWSSGKALTPTNYASVRATMMAYKGESGEALGVRPNLLVVPPQLEGEARMILNADFIAPGTYGGTNVGSISNPLKGSAELLVIPELAADATSWYLLDTSWGIKPFLYQERQSPIMVPFVNPSDPSVFYRKQYEFGVDMRGAAGIGLWFLSAKAVA